MWKVRRIGCKRLSVRDIEQDASTVEKCIKKPTAMFLGSWQHSIVVVVLFYGRPLSVLDWTVTTR
jgi:hypothetical protein